MTKFQAGIAMIRLRSPDDLACEHQSQVNHWPTRSENHVILGSLVLTHYQRVTDRQTDAVYSQVAI